MVKTCNLSSTFDKQTGQDKQSGQAKQSGVKTRQVVWSVGKTSCLDKTSSLDKPSCLDKISSLESGQTQIVENEFVSGLTKRDFQNATNFFSKVPKQPFSQLLMLLLCFDWSICQIHVRFEGQNDLIGQIILSLNLTGGPKRHQLLCTQIDKFNGMISIKSNFYFKNANKISNSSEFFTVLVECKQN